MPVITIRRSQMSALHAAQLAWEAQALLRRHRPSEYAELCRLDRAERSRAIAEQAMACRVNSRAVFPAFACLAWRWGPELNANGADSALHHILTDNWFNGDEKLARWKAQVDLEKVWTWD